MNGGRSLWRVGLAGLAAALLAATSFVSPYRPTSALLSDTQAAGANVLATGALAAPTSASASVAGSSIVVTWTATSSTFATGHNVLRSTTSGGSYSQIAQVTPRTTVTYTDSTVSAGVTYYYVLQAYYQNWVSANSNETSAVVPSTPITLTTTGDDYLRSGSANTNDGTATFIRVQQSGSNRALVQFDAASLTSQVGSKTVATAKLRLYIESNGDNWSASGRTVDVHRLSVAWTELGATWNCPIDTNLGNSSADCATQWAGGTYVATASASLLHTNGLLGWVEWDVTADVVAMVASPSTNYGWIVKKTLETQNGRADYTSREGASNHPQLYVTFTN
jgi:hypothetical protein